MPGKKGKSRGAQTASGSKRTEPHSHKPGFCFIRQISTQRISDAMPTSP